MHQYFMDQPLLFSPSLQRFGIEWTSLTRWSWGTTRFKRVMSDSISSRLLVGCLFDISQATLCQRFSIGSCRTSPHALLLSMSLVTHLIRKPSPVVFLKVLFSAPFCSFFTPPHSAN